MQLNLKRNTIWGLAEVVVSGLVLFALYRLVVGHLGIAALGIWSLVLATTSLGRLADIGTASALGRFVAATEAKSDRERALHYVETAIVTSFGLYLVIALVIAIPAWYGLALTLKDDSLVSGRMLLPYSLISFVMMSVTSAITGAVVGQHRADQKSKLSIAALLVQFGVTWVFIGRFGLPALAWAQISQFGTIMVVGWFLFLRNHFGRWTFRLPLYWRRDVFNELLSFGVRVQAISIASMLYDPTVKFLLSRFGGLGLLGYFEMAQRMILQVRQIIVMPTQALVPSFAHLKETDDAAVGDLYRQALAFSIGCGVPMLGGVALLSPIISRLWIGHIAWDFVTLTAILAAGWIVNLIAAPAYLMGVGLGYLRGNVHGAWLSEILMLLLGTVFGYLAGGYGVAAAAALSQAIGSLVSMRTNCKAAEVGLFPHLSDFGKARDHLFKFVPLRRAS